jgi:probable rRNA maturation factor
MSSIKKISFSYLIEPFYFPIRNDTKLYIGRIFKDHDLKINLINYVFCSDNYLLTLNNRYLEHNFYTDILTFDLSYGQMITADIFISVERAAENSIQYHVSKLSEVRRLLIHGALHLCGYKDKTSSDRKKMSAMEEVYLNKFFVSRETSRKTLLVKQK